MVSSRHLPISILVGPSARKLLRDFAATNPANGFAVLTDPEVGSDQEFAGSKTVVRPLPTSDDDGRDLHQVRDEIIALAGKDDFHHLFIECDSRTHPIAFASLFLPGGDNGNLAKVAGLHSIITAIDSKTLIESILDGNNGNGVFSSCILADQIECSDFVFLDADDNEEDLAHAIVKTLNPRANLNGSAWKDLQAPTTFDFEATFTGAGWRRLMDMDPGTRRGDCEVISFMYQARRPFHPEKFWNLLQKRFIDVFRAKGFFWLATRMEVVGGLNIAGAECHFSPAGGWWAAHLEHGHAGSEEIPDRLKKEWVEPFGDRRQAIAFMGIGIDPDELRTQLDACLLTESEMAEGVEQWAELPDPFPDWSPHSHDHDCGDHECGCDH